MSDFTTPQRRAIEEYAARRGYTPLQVERELAHGCWLYFDGDELKEVGVAVLKPEAVGQACLVGRYAEEDVMFRAPAN